MLSLVASLLAPLALLAAFPVPAVIAGAVMAAALTGAVLLLTAAGRRMDGPAGVWLLALPWAVRFSGLACITALAAMTVPDLARGLVAATGTGCIAALLIDLYRQVTARV